MWYGLRVPTAITPLVALGRPDAANLRAGSNWRNLGSPMLGRITRHKATTGYLSCYRDHVIAIRSLRSANPEPPKAAYRGLDQNCANVRFSDSSRKPTSLCPPGSSSINLRPGNRANSPRAVSSGTSQSSDAWTCRTGI
jgi:hypothetical protein